MTSVHVDQSKVEEAKAILAAGSARDAVDKALGIVIALHHQPLVLDEMKASPITEEQRSAQVVEYGDPAKP